MLKSKLTFWQIFSWWLLPFLKSFVSSRWWSVFQKRTGTCSILQFAWLIVFSKTFHWNFSTNCSNCSNAFSIAAFSGILENIFFENIITLTQPVCLWHTKAVLPTEAVLIVDQILQHIYGRAALKRCYCNKHFLSVYACFILDVSNGYLLTLFD